MTAGSALVRLIVNKGALRMMFRRWFRRAGRSMDHAQAKDERLERQESQDRLMLAKRGDISPDEVAPFVRKERPR